MDHRFPNLSLPKVCIVRFALLILFALDFAQFSTAETFTNKNKDDIVYGASGKNVEASMVVYRAVEATINYIKSDKFKGPREVKSFSVRIRGDEIVVILHPTDIREFRSYDDLLQLDRPSIYALLDTQSYAIKKIELCNRECGIYDLRWLNKRSQ